MGNFDLKRLADSIKSRFDDNETIKSFQGFLKHVEEDPSKYCRNSAQYLKDVFEHYGSYEVVHTSGEKVLRWEIFDKFCPVYGQEIAQNQIYNYICSFAENRTNKIILLHGPNGAAKTSLVASMLGAMEAYSRKPEGAVFAFNWVFSDAGDKEAGLGFGGEGRNKDYDAESLAFTDPEDITFKLACGMKDNPLLLIPRVERALFLEHIGIPKPHHLYTAELSQKSQEIFTQLSVSYDGDWTQIIRHVQVERFYYSKLFRKGLVSIDPQRNADANSRPLNLERSYRIPKILAMSSMYEPFGDLVDASRGIVEFSEIFKRHVNDNKYLLTTAEWGTISLPGFTAQLDCVLFATDNEKNLSAFKIHPDWPSFNGRFAPVRVPYVLKWDDEKKICGRLIAEHVGKSSTGEDSHVAPHTVDILSLWGIMTRLRKSKHDEAKKLTHLEKVELYNSGDGPILWSPKARLGLERDLVDIALEYEDDRSRLIGNGVDDASYEGRSGASYRDIENIVVDAIHQKGKNNFLSPLSVFSTIEAVNKNASVYEFVRLHEENNESYPQYEKGFLPPEEVLALVQTRYCREVSKDLQKAAGLISDDAYGNLFQDYIIHVKAWIKDEKVKNAQTGAYENPNEHLMRRMEEKLEISSSDHKERRREFFAKIAAWTREPGVDVTKGIPFAVLFSDLFEILRRNSEGETKTQLKRIKEFIPLYETEDWKRVPEDWRELVTATVDNMIKSGYTMQSLKEAVVFVVNHTREKD
jgi:serine protein kinase